MNQQPPARPPIDPTRVKVWIFDLDNTLYSPRSDVMQSVSRRMTSFIEMHFELHHDDARMLQKDFFLKYGTTLRGLMLEHGIDAQAFLDYVHDVDLTGIEEEARLARALDRLPGRKLIYTNASTRHAQNVLARLGILDRFETIFDIAAADFIPKPDPAPYADLVKRHEVDPTQAVMLEDIARNLKPAAAMGMTTVWVRTSADHSGNKAFAPDGDYVHHTTTDIIDWLDDVAARVEAPAR